MYSESRISAPLRLSQVSILLLTAASAVASYVDPAGPAITAPPDPGLVYLRDDSQDVSFWGYMSESGTWGPKFCGAGQSITLSGAYGACKPTAQVTAAIPTGCRGGSIVVYPSQTASCSVGNQCNTRVLHRDLDDKAGNSMYGCGVPASSSVDLYLKTTGSGVPPTASSTSGGASASSSRASSASNPLSSTRATSASTGAASTTARATSTSATTNPTTNSSSDNSSSSSLPTKSITWIIGVSVGGAVGLVVLAVLACLIRRRRQRRRQAAVATPSTVPVSTYPQYPSPPPPQMSANNLYQGNHPYQPPNNAYYGSNVYQEAGKFQQMSPTGTPGPTELHGNPRPPQMPAPHYQ